MADNQIILKGAVTLFTGNVPVEVPAGTALTFPTAHTRDALAEQLAGNSQVIFAENRDQLAHEFVDEREVSGERVEQIEDIPAEPVVETPAPEGEGDNAGGEGNEGGGEPAS